MPYKMMRSLIIILTFMTFLSYGQTQVTKDSLINEICKMISEESTDTDSAKINEAYKKHLYPFLAKYSQDKWYEIAESIHFRMQVICGAFTEALLKAEPPNQEWEWIIEKPKYFPDKKTCRDIDKNDDYIYIESTGDTVRLSIKNGYWIDTFKDKTYSKLKIHWLTDCEFEIEFIESNNRIRKNLSKKGDRYKYYIIEKGTNYYYLAVDLPDTDKILGFKIYN